MAGGQDWKTTQLERQRITWGAVQHVANICRVQVTQKDPAEAARGSLKSAGMEGSAPSTKKIQAASSNAAAQSMNNTALHRSPAGPAVL